MASGKKPTLCVSHDVLEYRSAEDKLIWAVSVKDIILMAEYTTDEGPIVDDYFLVFVAIQKGMPYFATASFYSNGQDEVIKYLAQQWASEIELGLAFSTEWQSRVVWPSSLAGQEYFECKEVRPKSILAWLRNLVLGPVHEYVPSKSIRAFLDSRT